ncbi:flippase-like domain-containing protein [candidate division GN15 bacterium]|nr:flippase-like domain-containing protein [candidate division GN15 bacterium]
MANFWKKKQFWGTLIGLALLAYCVKDIRLSEIEALLDRVNPYWVILTIVTSFVFIASKALRWRLAVSTNKDIPIWRSITLYSAGQFLGIVMPALTGQVGRVILFAKKEQLRKTFVFSTIVLEVLFDAITMILFMFLTSLAFAFPENYRFMSYVVAGVTVGAVVILYLLVHYREKVENLNRRLSRDRWPGMYVVITKFLRSFCKGIELLRSSQHVFGCLAYSLVIWTLHVLVVWFLMLSFGLELPLAAAAVVMIINTIILMIPITPGNAGTFETAVSWSLAAFSVGRTDAVLFALALHIIDLLPVVTCGLFFFKVDRAALREIRERHKDDDLLDRLDDEGSYVEEEEEKV